MKDSVFGVLMLIFFIGLVFGIYVIVSKIKGNRSLESIFAKQRKKRFKMLYKKLKKVPFERVYATIHEYLTDSFAKRGITNISLEIYALFLFLLCQMKMKDIGMTQLYNRFLDMQPYFLNDSEIDILADRLRLYSRVENGLVTARGDSLVSAPDIDLNILLKSSVVFMDLACFPSYRDDYENAPVCIQSFAKMREQTAMFMNEVLSTTCFWVDYLNKYMDDGLNR